ncbi:MAG: nucleotide exchange factor GrpE [Pseudonocardiales bacterium]|nr:nucleotide exchange factor GrpE [Pseudonocardiales bacterium]
MSSKDGGDGAAAESTLHSAQPAETVEQRDHPGENGYVAEELGVVPMAGAPLPAELTARLTGLEAGLTEMARQFASENARALARERVIDRQHAEIERLRGIERTGQLRPVVTDLCRLRNGLLRQAGTIPAEMTGPQVATLLESFAATVQETLERCGVTVLLQEAGAAFAPSRQQVASVVEINDPERDGTVAEVVQDGYAEIAGGKVVVPARVKVHRYVTKEKMDG